MRRRKQQANEFELPAWIVELAAAERGTFDSRAIGARLSQLRVTALGCRGPAERPTGITYDRDAADGAGWVDVLYDKWDSPVSTAVEELTQALERFELLSRLLIALTDMELVAAAARDLASAREREEYRDTDDVLEVGIVSMYARSFTGNARVGDRWRPESAVDRELHAWVMEQRHGVHAHADRTEQREVVNIHAHLEGPPIFAERRTPIPAGKLREIAAMCDRQYERFWIETGRLKHSIGSPASF